ncbi:unnamed protein product [Closterium sp. NIES-65]|nr:unnamed protein product [Closterium sp. NIES-65]
MRDVIPTVENLRCVSRLSLRNAPILPCPFTPNTTRSSQFSLPSAHCVRAAFFSSRPFLPYPPRRIQCPVRFRCVLTSLPSRRFVPWRPRPIPPHVRASTCPPRPMPSALHSFSPYPLMPRCSSLPLCVHSLSPLRHSHFVSLISSCAYTITFTAAPLLPCAFSLPTPCSSFPVRLPSHSLIPCAFTLIPLSFSHSVRLPSHSLIPCAFTLIPLPFSSHSPLILSFRVPSLSFPSLSLLPCASSSLSPLTLFSRARSLSFFSVSLMVVRVLSHSPPSLSSRAPSLSFLSDSLLPCAFSLVPLCASPPMRISFHFPLLISSRARSTAFPSAPLLPCAFIFSPAAPLLPCEYTLIPLWFTPSVCILSQPPLFLSTRAPALPILSVFLLPCAFALIPLCISLPVRLFSPVRSSTLCSTYSSLVVPVFAQFSHISSPPMLGFSVSRTGALAWCFSSLFSPYSSPLMRISSHSPLLISSRAPSHSFRSAPLLPHACSLIPLNSPPLRETSHYTLFLSSHAHIALLASAPLLPCAFCLIPLSFPSHSLIPCACTLIPLSFPSHSLVSVRLHSHSPLIPLSFSHSVRLHSHSPLIPLPFSHSVRVHSHSHLIPLSFPLILCQVNALLEILRKSILEIQDWKSYRDVQAYAESRATDGHRGWRRKTIRSRNKAWLEYWYCDPLIALQDLLKNPKLAAKMVFHADPQYVGNVRVYSTPETGLWWERLQTLVRGEDPDGVVAALILASDETHVDHRGKAKGHPVYLTLGNIDKDDRWQPFGHVLLALLPEFPAEYNVVDKMQVHNYIMQEVLQSLKTASYTGIAMKNAAGESINVWPYLWESDTILNPYLAVLPDVMHQADLGIYEHIVDFIRAHVKLLADRKKLDRILRMLHNLKTAFPHTSDWNFIKMHLISHYIDSIRRSGLPEHYSAQLYEHLHIEYIKNPYRASNKRSVNSQIVGSEEARLRLQYIAPQLMAKKKYDTAMVKVPDAKRDGPLQAIIGEELKHLRAALDRAPGCDGNGEAIKEVHVHWELAMPAAVDAQYSRLPHRIRALPMHHGRQWFSDVAVKGEGSDGDEEWFAKTLLLFHAKVAGTVKNYAFVKYYREQASVDAATKCKLGDDVITEEIKRRQLAKETALKTAAVNTLHGAPTVGKTAAAGRRGGSKRKRAAAGSGARGRSSGANGNIPAGSPSADNPTAGTSSEAEGANPAPVAEATDSTQNGAPTTGGIVCGSRLNPDTGALPAPPVPAAGAPGPMMAAVIEATEEGGVDPFIAYAGIEAGSDDEDGNDDDADDADGVQAGNDDELRAAEVRAAEVCAAEVRAAELRAAEVRAAELRAAEIRAAELRAAELRAAEVRAAEDRAAAVRAADVRSAEARQDELAPHTSQPNNPAALARRERSQVAGAHHFREARQLEAQLRDLQNTVSTLNAQLQEARARIKAVEAERDSLKTQLESMQRQLSEEVAGTSADMGALRDPSDPRVRMENVRKDVAGNPIIPSSISSDDAFDDMVGKTYAWLITLAPAGEMEFYPQWEEFQPHLVRKYIAEGTTQDEYYLFMGGNSKRIERALKVIGCKRANMNKPIKLWAWGAGGVIDEEKWFLLKVGGITPTKARDEKGWVEQFKHPKYGYDWHCSAQGRPFAAAAFELAVKKAFVSARCNMFAVKIPAVGYLCNVVEWPLENHKGKKGHASLDNNETNNRNNVHAKTRVVAAWLKETLEREPATFKIDEPMGFEMGVGKVRILIEGYELFFFPSGVVPTPWPPVNNL